MNHKLNFIQRRVIKIRTKIRRRDRYVPAPQERVERVIDFTPFVLPVFDPLQIIIRVLG